MTNEALRMGDLVNVHEACEMRVSVNAMFWYRNRNKKYLDQLLSACELLDAAERCYKCPREPESVDATGVGWCNRCRHLSPCPGRYWDDEEEVVADNRYEIRLDEDGGLDEVLAHKVEYFHLERMDDGHWWMRLMLGGDSGGSVDINLTARVPSKTKVKGRAEYND